MSSKSTILNNLRKKVSKGSVTPDININGIRYDNIVDEFLDNLELVGGKSLQISTEQNINKLICEQFPSDNLSILSYDKSVQGNIDLEKISSGHELESLDLTIIKGDFGVAENGAIWLNPPEFKHRASLFICQHLIILLEKNTLLNNMHEAYERIDFNAVEYGLFISGPSKTADIEQSLVIGAHGPRSCTVLLY